jgi:hypothetical protein
MYDIYGSPGFLAAYNAGPARLDDYLTNSRALPDETRRYVAAIGPNLYGASPNVRSPAEQYAMNALPVNIPPGTRYGRGAVQLASAASRGPVHLAAASSGGWSSGAGRVPARQAVQVAQLPEPPPRTAAPMPQQVAIAAPPAAPLLSQSPTSSRGFHLVSPAMAADTMAVRRGSAAPGQWAIQVGAFASQNLAQSALATARDQAKLELAIGRSYVGTVQGGRGTLWRARMVGLSKETAVQACEKLSRGRGNCIVLSPDAQS